MSLVEAQQPEPPARMADKGLPPIKGRVEGKMDAFASVSYMNPRNSPLEMAVTGSPVKVPEMLTSCRWTKMPAMVKVRSKVPVTKQGAVE